MFIHLREREKTYGEVKMEDSVFEVQGRILLFDGQCVIAFDIVKKIDSTFKASIISLYDEHHKTGRLHV